MPAAGASVGADPPLSAPSVRPVAKTRTAAAAWAHAGMGWRHQRAGLSTFEEELAEDTTRNPNWASGGRHSANCSLVALSAVSSSAHPLHTATCALIVRRSFGSHSS